MIEIARTDFIRKYLNLPFYFHSYENLVFTFRSYWDDGSSIFVYAGGDCETIGGISTNTTKTHNLLNLPILGGRVVRAGETLEVMK